MADDHVRDQRVLVRVGHHHDLHLLPRQPGPGRHGHPPAPRTPRAPETRGNAAISAARVYEIKKGELGRLYRAGGIAADSRDYLMNVDAVGSDFRLFPIPNCGKGQPMQTKRLGNGGPTMRSRPRVVGG